MRWASAKTPCQPAAGCECRRMDREGDLHDLQDDGDPPGGDRLLLFPLRPGTWRGGRVRWMKNSAGGPSTWTGPSAGPARGTTRTARTMCRSGPRKNPRNKRSTAAPEAALRGAAAGCRPVRARRTQSGLHDGWRILWRPRKAAALKLRRRQGRESRPRHGIKGDVSYFGPPPGGIRAGRPRPTRQVGRCTPPPLSGAPWQRA